MEILWLDMALACRLVGFQRPYVSARNVSSLQFDKQAAEKYITWAKKSTKSAAIRVPTTKTGRSTNLSTGLGTARCRIAREGTSDGGARLLTMVTPLLDPTRKMIPSARSKVVKVREKNV